MARSVLDIYKAIEFGLAHCIPFGKEKLSVWGKFVMVLGSRPHLATDPIKYRKIVHKQKL